MVRSKSGACYFCPHPIGQNSVTWFHLTGGLGNIDKLSAQEEGETELANNQQISVIVKLYSYTKYKACSDTYFLL